MINHTFYYNAKALAMEMDDRYWVNLLIAKLHSVQDTLLSIPAIDTVDEDFFWMYCGA